MRIYDAGTIVKSGSGLNQNIKNSTQPLVLAGHNLDYQETSSSPQLRLGGDYAEVIHYNRALNTAERKIVENYLGAKYNITVANSLYNHSNYAGEVAGIGRDDGSNFHDDAQGSAMVRINTPKAMGNGDFLLWGHNESPLEINNIIDVDQSLCQSRMSRVWAVTETGDVGKVDVIFDLTGFNPITPSDVRLLIDRNGNGFADNDVSPMTGNVSGNTITFSEVNFQNGDYFTLGSVNVQQTPLPVELIEFYLEPKQRSTNVFWTPASDLNADYYLVSKSKDGISFETFDKIEANGTTSDFSDYKSIDESPFNGISYYQLTQVDFDGKPKEYGPISVQRNQEKSFALVPNPTDGIFKLKSTTTVEENTRLVIYNSIGAIVHKESLSPKEVNTKSITLDLKSGVYFVKISQDNGFDTTLKLVMK